MFGMSLLQELLIVWAVVTSIMLIFLIYRGTLSAHEDDQLFLSQTENMLEQEHKEILKKERRIAPILYVLGTASGVLLLSIVGVWLWQGLFMT